MMSENCFLGNQKDNPTERTFTLEKGKNTPYTMDVNRQTGKFQNQLLAAATDEDSRRTYSEL